MTTRYGEVRQARARESEPTRRFGIDTLFLNFIFIFLHFMLLTAYE